MKKAFINLLGWVVIIGLVAMLLLPSLRRTKDEILLRATLEEFRSALQCYIEKKEQVVMLQNATGGQLAEFLGFSGCLETPPVNPATRKPFANAEGEIDWIRYEGREGFKSYVLTALRPNGETVWISIEGEVRDEP